MKTFFKIRKKSTGSFFDVDWSEFTGNGTEFDGREETMCRALAMADYIDGLEVVELRTVEVGATEIKK